SVYGELETARINELWRNRQVEMFGDSVELTEDYDFWWSYIPHFVHTPFYVYAYAFGELLTMALYARYKQLGSDFVKPYFKALAAGGSQSPEKLFKPLGVDLKSESFWLDGVSLIADMVQQVKKYSK
ncbi:MAG: hypothetical protein KDD62_08105, partial [Bdellovibrionales bacterium]|nr:hypothetical protein [Bdellovibrionales bacterium]